MGLAPTTTKLSASSSSINQNGSVTLTANVTSTASGSPTGSVQFLNGTTSLGSGNLSSGVATLTVTSLPAGTASITSVYSGDANFAGSTSSAIQVAVAAPAFTLTANPSSLTIAAGQSGKTIITLTAAGGYSGSISLSCSGLPANAACSFSPATLSANGSNTPSTSTLTITTDTTALATPPQQPFEPRSSLPMYAGCGLAGGLLLLLGFRRRISAVRRFRSGLILPLLRAVACLAAVCGCGGGSKSTSQSSTPVTPAGNATVKVTASAGAGGAQNVLDLSVTITN